MCDVLSLDLVKRNVVTNQLVLTVGYDIENLTNQDIRESYYGDITTDHYGRKIPKHAHGTTNLNHRTSSSKIIREKVVELYNKIVDRNLLIRRINISANNLIDESLAKDEVIYEQFDLFSDNEEVDENNKKQKIDEEQERKLQKTMLNIKDKYGKNSILKGMNLEEGATTIDRNKQIGGHKE